MATARPSGPDPPVRHPHPHVCTHSPTQLTHHWSPGPLSGSNPPHLPVPGPAQVRTVRSRHAPQPAPHPGPPAPPAVPLHGWLHPPQIQVSPCLFTARHPLPMKPACLPWAPEAPPTSNSPCRQLDPKLWPGQQTMHTPLPGCLLCLEPPPPTFPPHKLPAPQGPLPAHLRAL